MIILDTNEVTQISGGCVAAIIVLTGPIIASMVSVATGVGNQQTK